LGVSGDDDGEADWHKLPKLSTRLKLTGGLGG
jgi:hypothetical protein